MPRHTAALDAGSIGFLDEGSAQDPVVLVLDGAGSRLVGELAARVAEAAGVRVIAPDRPGYWESAARDGDVLATWPRVCAELLDHLGIEQAAVLGSSAACPHTFAAAATLGERITSVAIVGPMAPFGDIPDMSDMHPTQLRTFRLAQRRPSVSAAMTRLVGAVARRWPRLVLRMMASQRPEIDAERMSQPELRELMLQSIPGLMGPQAGDDFAVLVRDWGHVLDELHQPVRVWVGTLDSVHPPSMADGLQRRIAQASVVDVEGGFFACTDRLDEVLRWAANPG